MGRPAPILRIIMSASSTMLDLFTHLLSLRTLFAEASAQAQGWCGTTGEAIKLITERLLVNKEAYQQSWSSFEHRLRSGSIWWGVMDGSGVISRYAGVMEQFCTLNEDLPRWVSQFYIRTG